jgi:hypothetical protein
MPGPIQVKRLDVAEDARELAALAGLKSAMPGDVPRQLSDRA